MNTDRRDALKILLGVGGGAVVGGYVTSEFGGDLFGNESTDTPDGESAPGQLDIASRLEEIDTSPPDRHPQFSFDYEEQQLSISESSLVTEISASPSSERNGDRLLITPNSIAAESAASLFKDIWNVAESTVVDATVAGEPVTFSGGEPFDTAFLVGTATVDGAQRVCVTRGHSVEVAKSLAKSFDDFLE